MDKLQYLKEEYTNLKKDVYDNLVGNRYPAIVYDTLMQIRKEYVQLGGKEWDLPHVNSPDDLGYAR